METDLSLRHIKMALDKRQYCAFPRAGRTAYPQHLTRFKTKVHILQRRMRRLRIAKLTNGRRQFATPRRDRLFAILNYRRFRQHGADAAVCGATPLHDIKHPGQRQHRPNHQPQIHHKAGEFAQRQAAVNHHPASAANREQVRHANGDVNGWIKTRVNTRHAHIFLAGIFGIRRKQRRLAILQTKRFDHADAGQTLLRAIVQAGEGGLRQFEIIMQPIAVTFDHQRHNRHRQQR